MAATLTSIFLKEIQDNLFSENVFISHSRDDSSNAISNGGRTVVLHNAGAKPAVEQDRSVFPATAAKRVDTSHSYLLQSYTTDPGLITNADELFTSYDKMSSTAREHTSVLDETISDWILRQWAATLAGSIITTTGNARPATAPAATGDRNAVAEDDIRGAMTLLNTQNVPVSNRKFLVAANMYDDILAIPAFIRADQFGQAVVPTGVVGMLYGMQVMVRDKVTYYAAGAPPTPKDPGAAGAATDHESSIIWHPDFVRKAVGSVAVYQENDKPEWYGSIISAEVFSGGVKARDGGEGVVQIVQAPNP